jgi:leucyl/phenylalanyl-tRNA---protein transferase
MPVKSFPDPRMTAEDGIVALGGDLDPETLLLAYSQGIFPWPTDGIPLLWFCPDPRAVLEFADLHVPRSLEKARRKGDLSFTVDQNFAAVIRACAKIPRAGQRGTWITPDMVRAYIRLHELGHAHSVEVWRGDEIVGGVYGVDAGGVFAGESMFHLEANASKLALLFLVEHLRVRGAEWMDIQMLTPHMTALGAKEISREEFLERLAKARALRLRLF